MSLVQARDHEVWRQPGHPAPINGDERPRGRAGRTRLWDLEQALAYAEGRPVPELPQHEAPGDLLDLDELAALYGQNPATMQLRVRDGYVPAPDAAPYGVWHWRRDTLDLLARPGQGARTDRAQHLPGTGQQRVYAALEHDPELTLSELVRMARVSRPTASKWRQEWRQTYSRL